MKTTMISNFQKSTMMMLMVLCLLGFVSHLQAQQPGMGNMTPEERAKQQTEMMKTQLNLTPAQEPKVNAINLKYAKKMQEARNTTDTAARRKSFESLNKQKDAELKTVFTAEQFKTYQKLIEEIKAHRKQGGGPHK
jgi:Spy/CpxP family protein refolding chaperone